MFETNSSGQIASDPNSTFGSNLSTQFAQSNLTFNTPDIGAAAASSLTNWNNTTLLTGYSTTPTMVTSESGLSRPDLNNMNLQQAQASFGNQLANNAENMGASYAINKAFDITKINKVINGLTSSLTNSNGVGTRFMGGAANAAIKSLATSAVKGFVSNLGKSVTKETAKTALSSGLKGARAGLKSGLSSLGSAEGIAGIADAGLNVAFGDVKKAGWEKGVDTTLGVLSNVPVVGTYAQFAKLGFDAIGGLGASKTISANNKDWQSRQDQASVAGSYNGAMDDIANAESMEGKYSFWNGGGKKNANNQLSKTNNWKTTMSEWAQRNDLNDIRSNQMASINSNQYQTDLSGGYDLKNSGSLLVAKEGAKLFSTYKEIHKYTQRIKAAKKGAKLEPIVDKELERYYDDPLFSTKSKYNDSFHQGGSWSEDGKTFTPSEFSLFNFTEDQIRDALANEFPEASLNISNDIKAFKEGGKVEPNVIPDGALHARLNHMDNKDLTKKGIPVVAKDGDKLEQTAEIERNEIVFNLSVTNKLEELMRDGSAKAALEAGKLLTEEILHNTIDNTGLIDTLKQGGVIKAQEGVEVPVISLEDFINEKIKDRTEQAIQKATTRKIGYKFKNPNWSNCIATATDNYGVPIVIRNSDLVADPNKYGFEELQFNSIDNLPMGALIQDYNKPKDTSVPGHTIMYVGLSDPDKEGRSYPLYSYSSGRSIPEDMHHYAKYNFMRWDDKIKPRAYRYIGTPTERSQWEEEYYSLYPNKKAEHQQDDKPKKEEEK